MLEKMVYDGFTWVLGGIITLMSWFLKGALDRLTTVEEKYNTLHDLYVKKDDFKDFKEELWHRLDEIKQQVNK